MRILSRYVLREFLVPVGYCLVAFSALHLVFELFGEFDKIIAAKPPAGLVLRYICGSLAKDVQWLVTPSLMLGCLYSMWQLARHGEITAMRASGIGFHAITAPIMAAACVFAAAILALCELYVPGAIHDAAAIKAAGFTAAPGNVLHDVHFNNVAGRREWRAGAFFAETGEMRGVKVAWTDDEGFVEQTLEAGRALYQDGAWWFEDASVIGFTHQAGASAQVATSRYERSLLVMPELDELPRDFEIEYAIQGQGASAESLSSGDIRRYLAMRPNLDGPDRRIWVYEMVNRFAAPLACLFITLFAIPAGVATGRQSVFLGVVSAIALFIGYYMLSLICGVLAKGGALPVWFGIVAPNAVIFAAGMWLFARQR
ncbi:MAG: LptF/LptG family permease [Kiritimatiellae bacterium]|nr:LptF/LptG family permease [Kiritimatiellia bacterium]